MFLRQVSDVGSILFGFMRHITAADKQNIKTSAHSDTIEISKRRLRAFIFELMTKDFDQAVQGY